MLSLHPDTLAALKGDHLRAVLIKFDYTPTPVYLTTAPVNINHDGHEYLGNGKLLGLGKMSQTTEIRVGTNTVTFDAAEPSLVSILLNNSQQARDVEIYLAILNADYSIVGDPIFMQRMINDGQPKILDDPKKGKATIKQKLSSEFSNWAAKSGRVTTPASQQKYFPGDTGFDFAAEAGKEYKWGAK